MQSSGTDTAAKLAVSVADPARVIAVAWSTLASQAGTIGEQMVGVLGWLDTHLPLPFVQMTAMLFVLALLGATAGPTRRPPLALAVIALGVLFLFVILYSHNAPEAPIVLNLQGRYLLPFAAVLPLIMPEVPRFGIKVLALASVGFVVLILVEPAIVIRTVVIRYYLAAG
jgi:hypothetical protein